jgi:hypothetical protein
MGVGQNIDKQKTQTLAQRTPDKSGETLSTIKDILAKAEAGEHDAAAEAFDALLKGTGRVVPLAGAPQQEHAQGGSATKAGAGRPAPSWVGIIDSVLTDVPASVPDDEIARWAIAELLNRAPEREEIKRLLRSFFVWDERDYRLEELSAHCVVTVYRRLATAWVIERCKRDRVVLADRERYFRAALNGATSDVQSDLRQGIEKLLDRRREERAA